ncbi:unnamed protein product [Didymodactylos carnosus]|uniref:PEP-utilising enzyme mobile domain-containing protein n=2 Tax=Didymodactylos carnosus TaxID=1234261 RepID=A0A8S2DV98_9BILA|nr:unnamed protein product [Didymodactylos carnosus]CAF3786640.1 unnamed protein product [Didymodactylos carnosus]
MVATGVGKILNHMEKNYMKIKFKNFISLLIKGEEQNNSDFTHCANHFMKVLLTFAQESSKFHGIIQMFDKCRKKLFRNAHIAVQETILLDINDICFLCTDELQALAFDTGALVSEMGGMHQHDAMVSREYGLPTVVGIANAKTIFHNAQCIQVNGSTGLIKILFDEPIISIFFLSNMDGNKRFYSTISLRT